MNVIKKIGKILLNKYFLITLAFILWMVFFDSNNVFTRHKLKEKLNELKAEKHYYLDEIQKDSILTARLLNDSSEMERLARERYLMKKDNEDLFLVIDTGLRKK